MRTAAALNPVADGENRTPIAQDAPAGRFAGQALFTVKRAAPPPVVWIPSTAYGTEPLFRSSTLSCGLVLPTTTFPNFSAVGLTDAAVFTLSDLGLLAPVAVPVLVFAVPVIVT